MIELVAVGIEVVAAIFVGRAGDGRPVVVVGVPAPGDGLAA